ncbi:outer membrane beta-barrel protein [Thalassotalea ganghwensis]
MLFKICGFAFALSAAFSCHGSDPFNVKEGNELTLGVRAEYGVDDNLLYSDENKLQESFLKVVPTANIQTQFEQHLIQLNASTEHVRYQDDSDNNHSNVSVEPSYQYRFSAKQGIYVQGKYNDMFQARGTGLTLGEPLSVEVGDNKVSSGIESGYFYGQKSSTAKLKVAFGYEQERYQTRRYLTRVFDSESTFINPSFDYLVGGGSYFASDITLERIEFKNNPLQNRDKYVGLMGFKWQSTNITDVAILVGYQEIQFKDSILANDSAFKWRINVNWNPLEDVKLRLSSERDFALASRLQDSYRLVDNHRLALSKKWNDYVNLLAELSFSQEEIIASTFNEKEDYLGAIIEVQYLRNHWLSFYLRYQLEILAASGERYDYHKNSLLLGINVTL